MAAPKVPALRPFVIWLLIMALVGPAGAAYLNSGGDAGAFLRIPYGARAIGLGLAYASLAQDGSSALWNPAGFTRMTTREASFHYTMDSFGGDQAEEFGQTYGMFSYSDPKTLKRWEMGYALTVIYHSIPDIERTSLGLDGSIVSTGEMFNAGDIATYLTASKQIYGDLMSGGASLKMIHSSLDNQTANGFGLDLGMLIDMSEVLDAKSKAFLGVLWDINLGFTGRLHTNRVWSSGESENMPNNSSLGLSSKVFKRDNLALALAVSAYKPQSDPARINFGLEATARDIGVGLEEVALRAGVGNNYLGVDEDRLADNRMFGVGFGLLHKYLRLDFAMSFTELKNAQHVTLGIRF